MGGGGERGEELEVEAEGGDVLAEVQDWKAGCWVYYFCGRGLRLVVGSLVVCC